VEALRVRATEALFSMSHGRPDKLCAHGGDAALTALDAVVMGHRSVYAFACHTASQLGFEMSRNGVTWWGYTGAIQCPDDSAPFRILFVQLFQFIREVFVAASTATQRLAAFEEIARRCEAAQAVVDEHALRDPDLDVWSAYHCLLHVWDRLRIWSPGAIHRKHMSARGLRLSSLSNDGSFGVILSHRGTIEGSRRANRQSSSDGAGIACPRDSDVMTVEEEAAFLRIGRNALYDAIGRGEVPHRRLGKTIRLSRAGLMRWSEGSYGAASARESK
jgi:excisionase family DNA binding protein